MKLTDFQKQITGTIISGETCHIDDFITKFCAIQSFTNPDQSPQYYSKRVIGDKYSTLVFVPMNHDETYARILQFVSLWHKLEKADLIILVPFLKVNMIPIYNRATDGAFTPKYDLLTVINNYDSMRIVPLPELEEFVKAGHVTTVEIQASQQQAILNDEVKDRKQSQALTKNIAIISIVASFIGALITILFSYLTYKTDRTVTITNRGAFPDTTKIVILSPTQPKQDTLSAHSSRRPLENKSKPK